MHGKRKRIPPDPGKQQQANLEVEGLQTLKNSLTIDRRMKRHVTNDKWPSFRQKFDHKVNGPKIKLTKWHLLPALHESTISKGRHDVL